MSRIEVHRGDVFYADLGYDGTSRQGGIRPIVIVSNPYCNQYSSIISVVSLSTARTKAWIPTHVKIKADESGLEKDSICLCEQPMSIAKTALRRFVVHLDETHMDKIDAGLRCQLCL